MFSAVKRSTILHRDPAQEHLHILITDPHGPISQVLMVPVCTVKKSVRDRDKVCILNVGDHDFIEHESYVAYSQCRTDQASILEERTNSGLFVDMGLLDEDVFDRVIEGFGISTRVKPFARNFLAEANQ